jgi:hypothetical protein
MYFQYVEIHSANGVLDGKQGWVEECSVAPLRNKKSENFVWRLGKKGVQTKTYN